MQKQDDDRNKLNDLPGVTVAVCVLNGEETLAACLDSLMNLDYPSDKLNYLVIDNGSTDGTVEIVKRYPVELVTEETLGRGYARNKAWKTCRTPFIAFTDADCVVSEDWLLNVMPVFIDSKVGLAGSDIVTPGDSDLARFFELRQIVSNREFSGDYPFSPPFLATANAIFRIEQIRAVNGFNTDYDVAEDADICWRITGLGYTLKYVPGACIYHHHRTTLKGMFRQAISYGYGGVFVSIDHFDCRKWIWWGLYYRLLKSIPEMVMALFKTDSFQRKVPVYDFFRYSGLALGRISAGFKFRRFIF